jgi:hypothetical protein
MTARFLTLAQAAAELDTDEDAVLRSIESGDLLAIRPSPEVVRIPVPAFDAFKAGRRPSLRRVVRGTSRRNPSWANPCRPTIVPNESSLDTHDP